MTNIEEENARLKDERDQACRNGLSKLECIGRLQVELNGLERLATKNGEGLSRERQRAEEAEQERDSLKLANEQYLAQCEYWEAEADRLHAKWEEAETLLAEAASIVDDVMAYADCHTSPALLNAAERFSIKLRARKEGEK